MIFEGIISARAIATPQTIAVDSLVEIFSKGRFEGSKVERLGGFLDVLNSLTMAISRRGARGLAQGVRPQISEITLG